MDSSSSHVQVLDANLKWVFYSNTSMIECFKTHSVQVLGFNVYDSHAPTIPMADIKLLVAISAHTDMDLFYMNTTTALISAALQPGMIIYCNPPSGVDLGLRSNGFPASGNRLTVPILQQLAGLNPAVFSV